MSKSPGAICSGAPEAPVGPRASGECGAGRPTDDQEGRRELPQDKNSGAERARTGPSSAEPGADWPDSQFWERLDRLESRHRRLQSEHESARRRLDGIDPKETSELRTAWLQYCAVIAELERAAGEIEALRTDAH